MTGKLAIIQNMVLLVVAAGLAVYFKSGWSFLLLIFWMS